MGNHAKSKGKDSRLMTVEEALTLMFAFGMFILALLAFVVELIKTINKK